jgi:hypothetical protein
MAAGLLFFHRESCTKVGLDVPFWCPKAVVSCFDSSQCGYTEGVRYYTTRPIKGGTLFLCTLCEHRISTLDFRRENGNCRTQAATSINLHAHEAHRHQVPPIAADAYQRVWRA